MIEVIATLLRWLQLASNMILVGSCVFLAIAGSFHSPWVPRLQRALPWLGLVLLAGLLGILATTTAQATGIAGNAWRPDAWLALMQNTRMGQIWVARTVLALLAAGLALSIRYAPAARWRYLLCAGVATLTLVAGSLASHSAAEELSVLSILPYALHIILASVWFGALPAFLVICFDCTRPHAQAARPGIQTEAIARIHGLFQSREQAVQSGAQALKRFSVMALPVMLGVIATGILITDRMVDTSYAAMVSTEYGWLLNAKVALLCVVLVIAARARSTWLPLLGAAPARDPASNPAPNPSPSPNPARDPAQNPAQDPEGAAGGKLRRWVSFEFVLALGIVLLATIVANTVPAKHAIIQNWPYSFRFSLAATWGEPGVMLRVWTGLALLILAGGAVALGRTRQWRTQWRIALPTALAAAALAVGLPPLAIDAYPETYR
ncbi:MAG: CopD family protein, partial [Salinisphaera sp.]|nr:CopD family protein [Salinisphaera sp.]